MKRKIAIGLVVIMLCSLVGCDKKQEDNSATNVGTNGDAQLEEISDIVDITEIPETAEYTVAGDKGTINVAAEIKVPEAYEDCTVMELSRIVYEDEDIKTIADNIFDEGSYFLYMPYNDEAREVLREKLITASETAANDWDAKTFEYILSKFDEEDFFSDSSEYFEELKFYPDHTKEGQEAYFCKLFGAIDGRYYVLSFEKDDKTCGIDLLRWDRIIGYQLADYAPDSVDVRTSENASVYSQEESEIMAKEFVEKLGYEGYELVQSNIAFVACTLPEDENNIKSEEMYSGIDGYNVYLGRSYNNYSMVYSSDSWIMGYLDLEGKDIKYEDYPIEKFENTECIRVYIDNQGICEMRIYNPMEEVASMSEEIVFLSYDNVDNIAHSAMQTYADENSGTYKVETIELGYGIVDYNGKKTLIPVWYYFGKNSSQNSSFYQKQTLFMINALDGTVIEYE